MIFTIQHNKDIQQFFTIVDGKISTLKYSISNDDKTLNYYSTFVPSELRGQRIGDALVLFALNYAKTNHYKIIPSCPFVKKIIDRHPEYKSIITA